MRPLPEADAERDSAQRHRESAAAAREQLSAAVASHNETLAAARRDHESALKHARDIVAADLAAAERRHAADIAAVRALVEEERRVMLKHNTSAELIGEMVAKVESATRLNMELQDKVGGCLRRVGDRKCCAARARVDFALLCSAPFCALLFHMDGYIHGDVDCGDFLSSFF